MKSLCCKTTPASWSRFLCCCVYHELLIFLFEGQGYTGLHHAATGGHAECFHCLLQHGAEPSITSINGDNALDVARKCGKPRIIGKASKYMYMLLCKHNIIRSESSLHACIHIILYMCGIKELFNLQMPLM